MKNKEMIIMVSGLMLCAGMLVLAEEKSADEKKLDAAAVEMDNQDCLPACQGAFQEKIKTDFGVDDAAVQGLRDQKMGYGEITIALGLARQLPGGVTEANIQKIAALRKGPPVMGWGRIAGDLGLKLGPVITNVRKVSAEVRKQNKAAKTGKEKGGRPEKHERHGKMDRPGKGGRPDKPGGR